MQIFWWSLFWGGFWWLPEVGVSYFTFDWHELNSWNYRIRGVDFDDLWNIETQTFNAPMIDWGWVLWQFYRAKTITFNLSVLAQTVAELNTAIDLLKEYTRKTEWRLEINVNWTVRRCKASRTWLDFGRKAYHITFVPDVKLTFVTIDPHRTEKNMINTDETVTGDLTYTVDNDWTAPVFPVSYVNFWTGNAWITQVKLIYQWQTMTIDESFTNGDILTIDAVNKIVKKNNTEIDYDWVFVPLDIWENVMELQFNGWATVSAQLNTMFYRTYY